MTTTYHVGRIVFDPDRFVDSVRGKLRPVLEIGVGMNGCIWVRLKPGTGRGNRVMHAEIDFLAQAVRDWNEGIRRNSP